MLNSPLLMMLFKKQKGFTLLEVMVTLAILLVAVSILLFSIVRVYDLNRYTLELADAVNFARKGIESMTKEIREASLADNGNYPILEAEDQRFTFYSDIDADTNVERVTYLLDNTNLLKVVTEPTATPPIEYPSSNTSTTTVAQYIRNGSEPIFFYYNGDYPADTVNNPLSSPIPINEIRLVRLLLKININPEKAPQDTVLEIFIHLRNLKDNL